MSLNSLEQKIAEIKNRIYGLILVKIVGKIIFMVLIACFFSFCVDYFLSLPYTGRILLFGFTVVLLLYQIGRAILPLTSKIQDKEILIALERINPHLEEKIISAFQLKKIVQNPDYRDSKSLTTKIVEEAEVLFHQIQFRGILRWKPSFALLGIGIFFWFGIFSLYKTSVLFAQYSQIWWERDIKFLEVQWPKSTQMLLIHPQVFYVTNKENLSFALVNDNPEPKAFFHYRIGKTKNEDGYLEYEDWKTVEALWEKKWVVKNFPPTPLQFFWTIQEKKMHQENYTQVYQVEPDSVSFQSFIAIAYPDHDFSVKRGEDFPIQVLAFGKDPEKGLVCQEFSTSKEEKKQAYALKYLGNNLFEYLGFEILSRDFSFHILGGDDQDKAPLYRVTILESASIHKFCFWLQSPSYLGHSWNPEKNTLEQQHGNIRVFSGTRVFFQIFANVPLQTGIFECEESKNSEAKVVKKYNLVFTPHDWLPTPIDSKVLYGYFFVEESCSYKIMLFPEKGNTGSTPAVYYVRIEPDIPPVVEWVSPKNLDLPMSVSGVQPIVFKARDDFGLENVSLLYQVHPQSAWHPIELLKKIVPPCQESEIKHLLEIPKLVNKVSEEKAIPLQALDKVYIKAQAKDNNPKINLGESKNITITILENSELREILDNRLQQIKKELRRISEEQEKVQKFLEESIPEKGQIEHPFVSALLQKYSAQENISKQVLQAGEAIADILECATNNKLWDAYRKEDIEKVHEILCSIAHEKKGLQGKSPQASQFLMNAHHIIYNSQEEGKKMINTSITLQKVILKQLEEAIQKLGEWEDFQEIVRDLEGLIDGQKNMEPKIKSLLD